MATDPNIALLEITLTPLFSIYSISKLRIRMTSMISYHSVFQDPLPLIQKCLLICYVVVIVKIKYKFNDASVGPKGY